MEIAFPFISVLGALLLGAMSPGPSFLLVARTSMASRIDGFFTALGMGLGAVIFSVVVLFGLQAVLSGVPWLYGTLKVAGGLYLCYMAIRIWLGAKQEMALSGTETVTRSARRSLFRGLFTQLSNPKTAVVYGSLFAALLPHDLPRMAALMLPLFVFFIEAGWYCVIVLFLSSASPQRIYLRSKRYVDRIAGGVMAFLGVKLVVSAQ